MALSAVGPIIMSLNHLVLALLALSATYVMSIFRSNKRPKSLERERSAHPKIERDPLKDTIHQLQDATLSVRAGKLGTFTLRNMWQLNNPFTSSSSDLQAMYRKNLVRIFHGHNQESWEAVAQAVRMSIQPLIRCSDESIEVNIRDISRHATLVAVLKSLFSIEDVDHDRLQYIGNQIHRLTVGKKQFDAGASSAEDLPADLRNAADRLIQDLRKLFKDVDQSSPLAFQVLSESAETPDSINPLNLLIPAFEAPWRAIFYTLLALLQAHDEGRSDDIKALRDRKGAADFEPRALAVVYESLRLYPPIRRVRRQRRVDIESVQRHPLYWGSNADVWDPTRFLDEDNNIKTSLLRSGAAWMPFAVGSLKCPSANGYSARLVVVIVGEILRHILPEQDGRQGLRWKLQGPEWEAAAPVDGLLRAGREEYGSVKAVIEWSNISAR
ncbi:cytochrome P450 [Lophiotrema nucula]|uniref:Cytochrome P450 n=1 Tax=Lophiotrema nucula TaxID=690887 RepID=A0A6A5YR43_9PLEO|nr:cytochrome P450 [Lophiotrema nucula]